MSNWSNLLLGYNRDGGRGGNRNRGTFRGERNDYNGYRNDRRPPHEEFTEPTPGNKHCIAQTMKFSVKDLFSKYEQIPSFLRLYSHVLKKSLKENFIFCSVTFVLQFLIRRQSLKGVLLKRCFSIPVSFAQIFRTAFLQTPLDVCFCPL